MAYEIDMTAKLSGTKDIANVPDDRSDVGSHWYSIRMKFLYSP